MPANLFFKIFAAGSSAELLTIVRNATGLDWHQAIDEARQHQCEPLFRERLQHWSLLERLPADAQNRLTDAKHFFARHNLRAQRQLYEIATRLPATTRIIVLKGGCLSLKYYRDVSLRPMRDLDVLVRESDLTATGDVLRLMGYSQDRRFEQVWSQLHQEPTYFKEGDMPVELHRRLLDDAKAFSVDQETLWQRAVPSREIPGLWYLSPEDQLIHLCLHAAYAHEFNIGLHAFADIDCMARSPELQWPLVLERSAQWQASRCVFLALKMASQLVGAVIPDAILEALMPEDFKPAILQNALSSVYLKQPEELSSSRIFTQFAITFFDGARFRTLPGKIRRRLLLKPSEREAWKEGSGNTDFLSQIGPLFKGALSVVASRRKQRQLAARIRGIWLKQWMKARST